MTDKDDVDDEEEELKVILVGEMGTGKTSLINTAIGLKFQEKLASTTTNSIMNKVMKINGKSYSINLWDTAGQEKYKSITSHHYRKAVGALLVYDVTRRITFENCIKWYKDFK